MQILKVIRDGLIIAFFPRRISKYLMGKYEFAWLVHPRSIDDFYRKFPLGKFLPKNIIKFICKTLWPIVVSEITGVIDKNGKEIKGCIISHSLLPEQIVADNELAEKKILQALKLAERLGVKISALAAYNSVITKGGLTIKGKSRVYLTNSYALLSILGIENIKEILKHQNKDSRISFAIIGATTMLGKIFSKLLIRENINKLLLVGKTSQNLKTLKEDCLSTKINPNLKIDTTINISEIKNYDFVIIATNASSAIIKPDYLKREAIVLDITQPPNPSTKTLRARGDILLFDQIAVQTPGINYHFNFGLSKEQAYACLAELILLVMENKWENFGIGEINIEQTKDIFYLFKKNNFKLVQYK
ncbi:hypothetical protein KJ934_02290 [Patescibacteria group bacterium]|nr:hypothetical protein [Patescibacteria group bacterium]MBU4353598.1 hypothetical protein [Patescibacteria group bacterium]MBU4476893.1 hypothetical protein [Patescibacteria group bacterium]MCG2699086.1 hypothetical protein [Candidatus Parcubacteria bacterium]